MSIHKKFSIPGLEEYSSLIVRAALKEDLGAGDITTAAVVARKKTGAARLIAKEDFVLAGLFAAEKTFHALDQRAVFRAHSRDGKVVKKGDAIATIEGRLRSLLSAERVALNFLQRMSGIATLTAGFVGRVRGTRARILDTRKTTPCLRLLERYAVKAGGGYNHRFGLFDGVLIKDNHIRAAGGVSKAVRKAQDRLGQAAAIEVEVANLRETIEAVSSGADIIMLDNFKIDDIKKAVKVIGKSAFIEVSGGVTLERVRRIADAGADFISVGALTHSARAVDISMEIIGNEAGAGQRR
ncbi:MAG: carboxylating nicotinate-nucleotide diphosphorylase [Deltaproteobacteria bacterium]|nr:carboxylating nicotinate-nucleotide diphosphorylase [Deltaproteobacteria bacterium]